MPRGILEHTQSADIDNEIPLSRASEHVLHIGCDRPIRISAGHHLLRHDGKYSRPHGHSYEISVRVASDLIDEGWAVDKGVATNVIDRWDHHFPVELGDSLVEAFERSGDADGAVALSASPTTKAMTITFEERLLATLPDIVSEVSASVSEASELYADF